MSKPTYLLVHGAWGGAWCWELFGTELDARGARWRALDLPSSSPGAPPETYLIDDARDVAAQANELGPVILVGHSYGGSVITEAAPYVEDLRGLIYVAALLPQLGETSTDASRVLKLRTPLDEAIRSDGVTLSLDTDLARGALYQDCEDALANWALARLSTQTFASFRSPRASGDTGVFRRYVVCEDDRAIDPRTQRHLARDCEDVVEMASGHSPYLSRPSTLADLVLAPLPTN
ncbi:MAG: alpha/beta hydrolase [Acidobacteriota bacterium]|nr:alpha/beta hydrolase [Acidobacteriota bacterium]